MNESGNNFAMKKTIYTKAINGSFIYVSDDSYAWFVCGVGVSFYAEIAVILYIQDFVFF